MNRVGRELPAHSGLPSTAPTCNPGVGQQARWIDLEIFALDAERDAVGADPEARPFASGAEIASPFGDAIHALLAPPLGHLLGISDCREDTFRRSGDENFRSDLVLIGSDCDGCHGISSLILDKDTSRQILELFDHARPTADQFLRCRSKTSCILLPSLLVNSQASV